MRHSSIVATLSLVILSNVTARTSADDSTAASPRVQAEAGDKLVPLNKQGTVLLDAKGKRVLLKSKVVLREGTLEMLCCLKQTKEHESILAVDAEAYVIHTGLLAVGAKPGSPVKFIPEYSPPSGQRIDVFVQYVDQRGKRHRKPAQDWIRHAIRRFYAVKLEQRPAGLTIPKDSELRWDERNSELVWFGQMTAKQRDELTALSADPAYRKAIAKFHRESQPRRMDAKWVFAGSGFSQVERDGERVRVYQAEGGDLICVANFPTAMIDVAEESSASGAANLLYEAWKEHIPPVGTEVTLELVPVAEKPRRNE